MPKVKKKLPEDEKETKETVEEAQETEEKEVKKVVRREGKKEFGKEFNKDAWKPKTEIGKKVKSGEIKDIDFILDNGYNILESEIVDVLIPDIQVDLLLIGQSKGKFGGGSRRIFRQTQKKTREGNKPKFATVAVAGNENGYVGLGYGKSKETVPAREKSIRNAKLNMIKIKRGCGSWQCGCKEPHTIPYKVEGKCGSIILKLIPAPKGTGLKVEGEVGKILKLAGIKDVWSKTLGKTSTKLNLVYACVAALRNLMEIKTKEQDIAALGIVEGKIKAKESPTEEDFAEVIKAEPKKPKEKKK
ncbi:30S ribosomal protein S5 [Candidatus Woesearchaeota archaeon]|nr:30S ribosomal protein S5 [Candidatus Woesearchaeota archaeon]